MSYAKRFPSLFLLVCLSGTVLAMPTEKIQVGGQSVFDVVLRLTNALYPILLNEQFLYGFLKNHSISFDGNYGLVFLGVQKEWICQNLFFGKICFQVLYDIRTLYRGKDML